MTRQTIVRHPFFSVTFQAVFHRDGFDRKSKRLFSLGNVTVALTAFQVAEKYVPPMRKIDMVRNFMHPNPRNLLPLSNIR
jgi:hypothetical protein